MTLRNIFKRSVVLVAEDYWNGWLYTLEPDPCSSASIRDGICCRLIEDPREIERSQHIELQRSRAQMDEPDTWSFGAWVQGELAALCIVQARETYRRHGGFFDLHDDEAELAQVTTAPPFRNRGIGGELIRYVASAMRECGFRKLYAKIWRDNVSSVRVFERAGWKCETRFVYLRLRMQGKRLLVRLPG